MRLARLGLLLAVLAPTGSAQDGRTDARLAIVAAARAPIEARIEEAWRWRRIEPPKPEESRFLFVRPWRDGGLIALDSGGLVAFDGWSWRREPGWDVFQGTDAHEILPMEGGLVALLSDRVVTVDDAGRTAQAHLAERPRHTTRSLLMPDGSRVFAAGENVYQLTAADLGTLEILHGPPPGAREITALTLDGQDRLWCASDAGVFRYEEGGWRAPPSAGPNPDWIKHAFTLGDTLHFLPASIDELTPGAVWNGIELSPFHDETRPVVVGDTALSPDDALVFSLDTPTLRVYRDGGWADATPPLSSLERIRSVCITSEHLLALVTSSGRLWVCDLASRRWEAHDPSGTGLSPLVAALAPSPSRGGLWVGTHSGMGRWDGTGFTDVHRRAGTADVPLRHVTGIAEDARGRVWVGSGSGFHGALCLDGDTWTLHDGEDEIGERFVHVIRPIDGDLWFTLIGDEEPELWELGGAVRLRDGRFERFPTGNGGGLPRTYDVVRTPDGRLLAGTRHHIYELIDEAWQAWELPLLASRTAWALHPDRDGSLWVGLGLNEEGLLRVHPDHSETLLTEGPWLHSAAAAFSRTGDGRLWFASVSGLFLVDGNDCHEISGRLPARNFWPVVPDGEGGLWLGTLGSGLVHYAPDDREAPLAHEPEVNVRVEDRHTLVRFTAVDRWNVTLPEQIRFRVWLDDELVSVPGEWSGELQAHEIDIGRLPWGEHTVSYEAVDGLGNRSLRRARTFPVDPPIWLRPPLLLSTGAAVLALCWIAAAGRGRRRERRQARQAQRELTERLSVLARKLLSSQEDERKSISRELHDDLGQLLTAVCLDLQRADRAGQEERREALLRGLATTRTALDRVRELSSLLRPPVLDDLGLEQAVNSLIEEFTTRSGVDVQVELDLGPTSPPDLLAGQVFRIIQEALTNVARHADAETAFVTLRVRPAQLDLTVSDDGRGFDPDDVPVHNRFGLLGMRERAELLGGSFRLESAPGSGTSVRVTIPLQGTGTIPWTPPAPRTHG